MNSLERSGMEIMLLNSSVEWRRVGYQCDVLATAQQVGPLADSLREQGYGVFHIPFRSDLRLLPRLSFIRAFYRLCCSGYDVLHIHTEGGAPLFASLAKLAGVRRIAVTLHGIFDFSGALRLRKRCERYLVRRLGGRYGMVSEGIQRCEWERFQNKGVRIWNWLDTSHFLPPTEDQREAARHSIGIRPGQFVITSVGNCSALKNHAAILRALPLLPPTIDPFYLHVGREDNNCSERKLAASLRIENTVRFLESQPDPRPFLWAADAFVMPSLSEGLGMAAIEAIAGGTPTVVSQVPGLSETAAEVRWTVLTSSTPESVAEGLAKVAALEPCERRARALADSEIIRQRFSIQNGVQSIASGLYAS
jgi:glycosyltransferase involved in cell wall biosynthesis